MTPQRGVDTPSAHYLDGIRQRHQPVGCAGGRHVMHRDPDGPEDRPWKCRTCDHEQPWSGGHAAWLAAHTPITPAATEKVRAILDREQP